MNRTLSMRPPEKWESAPAKIINLGMDAKTIRMSALAYDAVPEILRRERASLKKRCGKLVDGQGNISKRAESKKVAGLTA